VRRRALEPLHQHLAVWKERVGCRRITAVDVQVQRPGRPAVLAGSMDKIGAKVTATLGTSWVLGVWARALAVVGDAFVLEVVEDRGPQEGLTARAARWEEQSGGVLAPVARPVGLTRSPEGDWALAWDGAAADVG
jgi:hypothetical protein